MNNKYSVLKKEVIDRHLKVYEKMREDLNEYGFLGFTIDELLNLREKLMISNLTIAEITDRI